MTKTANERGGGLAKVMAGLEGKVSIGGDEIWRNGGPHPAQPWLTNPP